MIEVHSKALDKTIQVGRVIQHVKGTKKGPTLIFMGGVHGNEPAGVFALKHVLDELNPENLKGSVYGIAGNLWALQHGERFHKEDLNRLWTEERLKTLPNNGQAPVHHDQKQQIEINQLITKILAEEEGPFYFFDMHTTSSETLPFLTVNDSLLNRHFTIQYPIPIILGIEEYLNGPILSYINELGYVAFGFEAGQHDDLASIENCISFIYLSLTFSGVLNKKEFNFQRYYDLLAKTTGDIRHIYEIYFHYSIKENEHFKMLPGYYNFQRIKQNQHIAESNNRPIRAKHDGRIFMPLYQPKGTDGFFAIKKIWSPFLILSEFFRRHRLNRILTILPGVKWLDKTKGSIQVDKRIARFMTKDIFHLFGYRHVYLDKYHVNMYNRDASARYSEYADETWINN